LGNLENIQCDGADGAWIWSVRSRHRCLGVSKKAPALADADGAVDQLSGVCVWTSAAWHRRRASVEFLLDRLPLEMEYAFAAGGGRHLHVDLRDDSAGSG